MKKIRLLLVRHGATAGNKEGRYVGTTDEELCPDSIEQLKALKKKTDVFASADMVFVSPMKRCVQTADILFGDKEKIIIPEFTECSFGEFEYKNYRELNGNPDYQRYIDSGGLCGFPKGETKAEYIERCKIGFEKMLREINKAEHLDKVAVVAHGGTIMAIMHLYAKPHRDYFEWQIKNAEYIEAVICPQTCIIRV